MKRSLSLLALLVSGALAAPATITPVLALGSGQADAQLMARGGGGRAGGGRAGGGGGSRMGGGGGGGGGGGAHRASRPPGGHSGFKTAGPGLGSGSKQPKGGWSKQARPSGGPSLDRTGGGNRQLATSRDRAAGSGLGSTDRQANRTDRQGNRTEQRGDRQTNRTDRLSDRSDVRKERIDQRGDVRSDRIDARTDRMDRRWDSFDNRWDSYPGWARPGWGYARPWNYGWYGGWATPSWGWWGARAAVWGLTTLTTAAIINEAVDDAVSEHVTYIAVPNSDYGLLYGTVAPVANDGVSFEVIDGGRSVAMTADCRQGTLNGREPGTAAEAELLNAACQVAYGST